MQYEELYQAIRQVARKHIVRLKVIEENEIKIRKLRKEEAEIRQFQEARAKATTAAVIMMMIALKGANNE